MFVPIKDLARLRCLPWSRLSAGRVEAVRLSYSRAGEEYSITVTDCGGIRITAPARYTGEPYTVAYEPQHLALLAHLIYSFVVINPDPDEIGDRYESRRCSDDITTILTHILTLISDATHLAQ